MSLFLNLMYLIALLVASPWIVWRRVVQGRYRRGWNAKWFGRLPRSLSSAKPGQGEQPTVWFHAVSVGELQVIRPIVEAAQRERPDLRIVITTSTDSGYDLACKLYADHTVSFAPLDFTWAVREAVARVQPSLLVLAELELWPNWIAATAARGIPIAVINARMSPASLQGYQRIGWIIGPAIRRLSWIGVQSAAVRERFLSLGCAPERVIETGNTKFDGASRDAMHPEVQHRREWLHLCDDDVLWLCGSTQSPEEQICLEAFAKLADHHPRLKLILVPRHAERFDEVAALIAKMGMSWCRRSRMESEGVDPAWRIFLADSVGELRWWWGLAQLGFVGGSFGSRGGQNMIEPCAYGVATCFGPNTRNFSDAVSLLLDADAAVQLATPEQLYPWMVRMLERPEERHALGARAAQVTDQHRGAVARTWRALVNQLPGVS